MSLRAVFEAARPSNAVLAFFAVFIGGVVSPYFSFEGIQNLVLVSCIAATVTGGGNILNDVFDREIDAVNKPNRPIPSGRLSVETAKRVSFFLLLTSIFSVLLGIKVFLIGFFNSILLYVYSWRLKRMPLAGNLAVSFLVGSTFLFGGAALGGLNESVPLFVLAFLATLGREVVKDVEDVPGDQGSANTLATFFGVEKSASFASIVLVLAVILSPLPFLLNILNVFYLLFVAAADIIFLISAFSFIHNPCVENASKVQFRVKIGMVVALIGFLAGSV